MPTVEPPIFVETQLAGPVGRFQNELIGVVNATGLLFTVQLFAGTVLRSNVFAPPKQVQQPRVGILGAGFCAIAEDTAKIKNVSTKNVMIDLILPDILFSPGSL